MTALRDYLASDASLSMTVMFILRLSPTVTQREHTLLGCGCFVAVRATLLQLPQQHGAVRSYLATH